mmetsp:Transcript_107/g.278  ORF Transcript_107/g.278 Transcript_107/m.278 type:complete len:207 (-) Transcript_107:370-990(-)
MHKSAQPRWQRHAMPFGDVTTEAVLGDGGMGEEVPAAAEKPLPAAAISSLLLLGPLHAAANLTKVIGDPAATGNSGVHAEVLAKSTAAFHCVAFGQEESKVHNVLGCLPSNVGCYAALPGSFGAVAGIGDALMMRTRLGETSLTAGEAAVQEPSHVAAPEEDSDEETEEVTLKLLPQLLTSRPTTSKVPAQSLVPQKSEEEPFELA